MNLSKLFSLFYTRPQIDTKLAAVANTYFQASSDTKPSPAREGDWLFVTSDGTETGSFREKWIYTGTQWVQTEGLPPVSGAVIDNTIADPSTITTVGRYIVPATGLSGVFVGNANKFGDFDGTAWTFVTPANKTTVNITSGTNSGQIWRITSGAWAQVVASSGFAIPNYNYAEAIIAGQIRMALFGGNSYPIVAKANAAGGSGVNYSNWRFLSGGLGDVVVGSSQVSSVAAGSTNVIDRIGSNYISVTGGSGTTSINLPRAFDQPVGACLIIRNKSSGVVNVNTDGGKPLSIIQPNMSATFTLLEHSNEIYGGSTVYTGVWDVKFDTGSSLLTESQTVASAAGTTTLNGTASRIIEITGTSTQTIRLPSTTGMLTGTSFTIINSSTSTGVQTIQNSSGGAVTTLALGETVELKLDGSSTWKVVNKISSSGAKVGLDYAVYQVVVSKGATTYGSQVNVALYDKAWNQLYSTGSQNYAVGADTKTFISNLSKNIGFVQITRANYFVEGVTVRLQNSDGFDITGWISVPSGTGGVVTKTVSGVPLLTLT